MTPFPIVGRIAESWSRMTAAPASMRQQSSRPSRRIEDGQFKMMEAAFGRTGGCMPQEIVASHLRHRAVRPSTMFADWIAARAVVSFPWGSHRLVPLFQFHANDMSLSQGTADVVLELVDVFDDWNLALWFAQPNTWLENAAPIDVIEHDQTAVHAAARADRYIARG